MPERFARVLEVAVPSASVYLSRIKTRDWRPSAGWKRGSNSFDECRRAENGL
jgi:hypothetical protein